MSVIFFVIVANPYTHKIKIVEDNLKALESLAVVGLVPKVMTILETRGAWDEEEAEGETAAEAPAGSGLWLPQGGEEDSSKKTDNVQKPPPRRRGSGYSSIGSGNRPKVCACVRLRCVCVFWAHLRGCVLAGF